MLDNDNDNDNERRRSRNLCADAPGATRNPPSRQVRGLARFAMVSTLSRDLCGVLRRIPSTEFSSIR